MMRKACRIDVYIGRLHGLPVYGNAWKFPNFGVYRYGLSARLLSLTKARRF